MCCHRKPHDPGAYLVARRACLRRQSFLTAGLTTAAVRLQSIPHQMLPEIAHTLLRQAKGRLQEKSAHTASRDKSLDRCCQRLVFRMHQRRITPELDRFIMTPERPQHLADMCRNFRIGLECIGFLQGCQSLIRAAPAETTPFAIQDKGIIGF